MRGGVGERGVLAFDMPPRFPHVERRRAGAALAVWQAGGGALVPGHDDHSVVVGDPGGAAWLRRVGVAVTETFGIVADTALQRRDPITTELCAACDLIALNPVPLHFEASLMAPGLACVLLRGVALPIDDGAVVQIVLSWREVLNRAATARLERDLTTALRLSRPILPDFDPFSGAFAAKSRP
ncbi:MAG: hypothetical protein H7316_13065 [Tardiphaga sp.]|uniref:hypothetical protein n=1 Tax=Tardiphaga sp. TaxID=1926292 RepID=UPI0019AAA4B7|nr:hypothetical protein [Tardiphaga sp.]MBC7584673.1 hypothetical protein [Tardiphaga sp.]